MTAIGMNDFYDILPRVLDEGQPFALGVISGIKGSSPQKQGAKALFMADGRILGTLGGGCLEAEVQDRARRALSSGQPATFDLLLDHDFGWDDGLICGGRVEGIILPMAAQAAEIWRRVCQREETLTWGVTRQFEIALEAAAAGDWLYRETVSPPAHFWIAGSGHIAQAVAPLARHLDFAVTVFDDRPGLANSQHFPAGTRFHVDTWDKLVEVSLPSHPVFGLIVTRGHQRDALVLRHWIQRSFAFLGMIGSSRKKRIIFERFIEDGLATEAQLASVACPVGASIRAVTVHEIAVSIMAQYIEKRAGLRH